MDINRYALVENGLVTNVILWDGNTEGWQPAEGTTAELLPEDSPVGPGWSFDGANYVAPEVTQTPQGEADPGSN